MSQNAVKRPNFDPAYKNGKGWPGAPEVSTFESLRATINTVTAETVFSQFPNLPMTCTDIDVPLIEGLGEKTCDRCYLPDEDIQEQEQSSHTVAHGGGQIAGNRFFGPEQFFRVLPLHDDYIFVSVEYRLAPEHPAPAGAYDCYAALVYLTEHATELSIDPSRILVCGLSGGAAPIASTCLLARDRNFPSIRAAMLSYPQLDDRNDDSSHQQFESEALWCGKQNKYAWDLILGQDRDSPSELQVPGRAKDLSRLPPVFIGVGECEVFRDGAITYANRIWSAGGSCELHVWPGVYHAASNIEPEVPISQAAAAAERHFVEIAPACSQCQNSPVPCRYQEGGKRGLPTAYMASLENRLQDTEAALYDALRALQSQSRQEPSPLQLDLRNLVAPKVQLSKAEKQKEWEQYPLRTNEELSAWFAQYHGENTTTSEPLGNVRWSTKQTQDGVEVDLDMISRSAVRGMSSTTTGHRDTRTQPVALEDALTQLQNCRQPPAPNVLPPTITSTTWVENYF
ncbi:alpha/beta-hydrolase [Setomelanomma holmii]|uniref:Alpha/beta-hydrolase n=1 Tax=Setomelanomma holmii TaxID=210430 RepID=A0A9P4H369_9PLEO|nr:alpha/beta-hydrolase [Setomelanomma holmii]